MFHTIQFDGEFVLDLEVSRKKPLERLVIHPGMRVRAQVKPYVVEGPEGPVEVADLFFEEGTAARVVPFACFSFVD